jgi:hypothetical protein
MSYVLCVCVCVCMCMCMHSICFFFPLTYIHEFTKVLTSNAAKSSELAEMLEELDVQPMPAAWKGRKQVGVAINGIVLVYNGL